MPTRYWLRLEGMIIFIIFIGFLIGNFGFSWILLIAFWLPDLSMIGYAIGPKFGAWVYNLGHSYICPLILLVLSYLAPRYIDVSTFLGIYISFLWFAHIGFDHMLGYGLKEVSGFKDTHLGKIGKN